ncbi:ATP-dependent 6-phosphofructokinase [Verrucomicrobiota bacterium]|jgi:phosphofructokinase-like protein|nr:ATP-dependent 6-phosphofructokinase [Verrucomicrobiota bacterium]
MIKTIGVLTSGGDCPGLNAVLRGIVCTAAKLKWRVVGFRDGYEGLLADDENMELTLQNTEGIMQRGGTILGTTSRGHFVRKAGPGGRGRLEPHIIARTKETLEKLHISALVTIGGDGSLATSQQLFEAGIPVIGVPKTIDNDLEATESSFGFDSAVACVTDALDRLHTTARAHKRVIIIEVMGRHAGWIALHGGLAGGADAILLPEIPFSYDKLADAVRDREKAGHPSTLIVVAEGARPTGGREHYHAAQSGEYRLGGIGETVARELDKRINRTRLTKEIRTCVLGHLQRGGDPTTLDRILGTSFGVKAVDLIAEGKFGQMVSYQNYQVLSVPIASAVRRQKIVQPDCQMVATCRAIGISFGD